MKTSIIVITGLVTGSGSFRLMEALVDQQWAEAVWVGSVTLALIVVGFWLRRNNEKS